MTAFIDASAVIDRLRALYGVASDRALAKILEKPTTTISSWRTRPRVPFEECVEAVRQFQVSFDWLLRGVGSDGQPMSSAHGDVHSNVSSDRVQRMMQFIAHWQAHRTTDEVVWLEMQLTRAVPEYAEWVGKR